MSTVGLGNVVEDDNLAIECKKKTQMTKKLMKVFDYKCNTIIIEPRS